MRIVVTIAAALLLCAGTVHAQQAKPIVTGNDFLDMCSQVNDQVTALQGYADGIKLGECLGFLEGVRGTLAFMQLRINAQLADVSPGMGKVLVPTCMPTGVTAGQLTRILLKWLNDNPTLLHNPLAPSAVVAFDEAFPCEQQK